MEKPKQLTCCCCGGAAFGRQFHNQDTGYGLCSRCVPFAHRNMTEEEFRRTYGEPGIHYRLPGWVVLEECGNTNELEVAEFQSFSDAFEFIGSTYSRDEEETLKVEIMKRLKDGTLTTEF